MAEFMGQDMPEELWEHTLLNSPQRVFRHGPNPCGKNHRARIFRWSDEGYPECILVQSGYWFRSKTDADIRWSVIAGNSATVTRSFRPVNTDAGVTENDTRIGLSCGYR